MLRRSRLILVITVVLLANSPASAQWVRRSIQLEAGWNAVFLEEEPYPLQCDLQFQGLPVRSVWTYDPRFSPVEFVQDPGELTPDLPEWRFYAPPASPYSFATNLFILQAGKAYLIDATEAATWNVVGQPALRRQTWNPDGYNLVGFPVNPASPPTFASWFAGSDAHSPLDIWRLGAGDQWEKIANPAGTTIQSGQAYWVYCYKPSIFQGPVQVQLPAGTLLDYGKSLVEYTVKIDRPGAGARTVTVSPVSSQPAPDPSLPGLAGDVPLTHYGKMVAGEVTTYGYYPLPATLTFAVTDTVAKPLRIAVDRASMVPGSPGDLYQSLLEVKDNAGFRRLIGVRSQGRTPEAVISKPGATAAATDPSAGLWVGTVTLDKVSEAMREPDVLTGTPAEFNFRVILHVDGDGIVRLLNEVIQFWRPGTMKPDPNNPGYEIVDQPGRYILLTPMAPQSLVDEIGTTVNTGVLRDGRAFARRISTVAYSLYDAEGSLEEPTMNLTGEFGAAGSILDITFDIEDSDPLNPFHHAYHPKHLYPLPGATPIPSNDWTVQWHMTFSFTGESPDGVSVAGWGDSQVGGTYVEEVTGLKSELIKASGIFRLQQASTIAVLNDGLGG